MAAITSGHCALHLRIQAPDRAVVTSVTLSLWWGSDDAPGCRGPRLPPALVSVRARETMHLHCGRPASASRRTSPNSRSRGYAARPLPATRLAAVTAAPRTGISQLAALGKQLVECLPHAGAAALLTVIMAREHPAGCQESQRPADVVADSFGLVVAIDEDQPEAGLPGG